MINFVLSLIKIKVKEVLLIVVVLILLIPIYTKLGYENIDADQFLWCQRTGKYTQSFKSY